MDKETTLKDLEIGESAVVTSVGGEGALRQHFLDMGVIPGAEVSLVKYAPMGDPMELRLHGYELTLRLADAEKIQCDRELAKKRKRVQARLRETPDAVREGHEALKPDHLPNPYLDAVNSRLDHHPGLGEGGRFHDKKTENPLPDSAILTYALAEIGRAHV